MKKTIPALILGAALLMSLAACGTPAPATTPDESPAVADPEDSTAPVDYEATLDTAAATVLEALKSGDYAALSAACDEDGVTFTPYSFIDTAKDVKLSPAVISGIADDKTAYTWGNYDGSGDPIELTIADYFARFVWNADYTTAPDKSVNKICQSGNSIENIDEVYTPATEYTDGGYAYIDYHFSGIDETLEGLDWTSLKLVFILRGDAWKLCAVVHGEWTI